MKKPKGAKIHGGLKGNLRGVRGEGYKLELSLARGQITYYPIRAMSVYRTNACNMLPQSNISDATKRIGGISTGRFCVVRITAVINTLSIGQKALISTECASPISLTE